MDNDKSMIETKNELFYSAMVACGVNAFIMWVCAD